MTGHRGRFLALLVGMFLLTGLTVAPGPAVARTAIHKSGDANALAGRGMWIWYVSRSNGGSVASIVATARKYGISTVMIKSSDGRTMWSQFNSTLVSELHADGLHVCAWQYVYGNFPRQEANVGATAVQDGADCLIIDAESEYEGKYVAAQSYITQLRNEIGQNFPVALAGFPYVDYHPGFPYSIFLGPGGAQYNTPQMYWVDIGTSVNAVYAHTYAYNNVYQRAIDPLGQVYGNPPLGQLIRFRQLSRTYGAAGVSWWDWQQASTTGWKGISIGAGNLTSTATTSTPILKLHSVGDLVVWAQEHLATAGYSIPIDGDYGPTTQADVESFQAAEGLTPDGIVGPATWSALLHFAPAAVTWTHTGATIASAAAVRSSRAHGGRLLMQVPKSAHARATRDEIAGAGGAG
ncbi:MAG TPA: peptidoglycan-binding domain-containing protein [Solirubrobacteraceae bacterium]|nr:peptidoglycan-binding domain-containing protein [Solirubrobacteraceae bacterium]